MSGRSVGASIGSACLSIILACLVITRAAHADVTWADLLSDPDTAALNPHFVAERLATGAVPAADSEACKASVGFLG